MFLSKLLPALVFPDGLTCLLLAVTLWSLRRSRRLASAAAGCALLLLYLASNPLVCRLLVSSIESQTVVPDPIPDADAIVVLSGGAWAPEPPRPFIQLSGTTANRLLYAAKLYRDGKAPLIVVSGGQLPWNKDRPPESEEMAQVLQMMGVPASAVVQENQSGNTYQNAVDTRALLEQRNLHRIVLVTSAIHMPRAMRLFRQQGVNAVAAPTDFLPQSVGDSFSSWQEVILMMLPSAEALANTTQALKELLGAATYRILGRR